MASEQFDERKFAGERSARDAQSVSEHWRAAAQASILINGGAATAVLAYSASDKRALTIPAIALSNALTAYAIGVALGATMLLIVGLAIERWMLKWQDIALDKAADPGIVWWAQIWKWGAILVFGVSIACFVIGSYLLAQGIR